MASNYWAKIWIESLYDPKIGGLSHEQYRRFIELILLAKELNRDGELPPIKDIAWKLRADVSDIERVLSELAEAELQLLVLKGGIWYVKQFKKRQEKTSNAERQRRYREKQKRDTYYGEDDNEHSNESVTKRNTDTDTDTDTDTEAKADKNRSATAFQTDEKLSKISKLYESEIGGITRTIHEEIKDISDSYPFEWFEYAVKQAVLNNARNLKYILAILKRIEVEGFNTNRKQSQKQRASPQEESFAALERARLKNGN